MMTRFGILGAVLAVLWLSPTAAAAEDDGIWLDISGCKIWIKDQRATIDTQWDGTCRLGKATAVGSFIRRYEDAQSGTVVETYTGRWIEGRQQGKGRYESTLGTHYDGEFKDGLPDGLGIYRWADGSRYSGGWKAGLRVGRGTYTWANGASYEGEWVGPAHRLGCLFGYQGRQLRGCLP